MYKTRQNQSWCIRGSYSSVTLLLRLNCAIWFALWFAYLKIILPWKSYARRATFVIPWEGSYRARYKQTILAGEEQQNSYLKSTLTWNFAHSYMFSRPELMLALLFQRTNRISVWLFSLAIWICLVCCYVTVSCEKKPNMPMGYFAENKMISGVIYVAQCGMVESDFFHFA